MIVDLDVQPGTIVHLTVGDWYDVYGEPAHEDTLVQLIAVDREMVGGLVGAHGHDCNPRRPDCGRDHCWEGRVLPAAIRRETGAGR